MNSVLWRPLPSGGGPWNSNVGVWHLGLIDWRYIDTWHTYLNLNLLVGYLDVRSILPKNTSHNLWLCMRFGQTKSSRAIYLLTKEPLEQLVRSLYMNWAIIMLPAPKQILCCHKHEDGREVGTAEMRWMITAHGLTLTGNSIATPHDVWNASSVVRNVWKSSGTAAQSHLFSLQLKIQNSKYVFWLRSRL